MPYNQRLFFVLYLFVRFFFFNTKRYQKQDCKELVDTRYYLLFFVLTPRSLEHHNNALKKLNTIKNMQLL